MHSNVVTTPWSTDQDRIQPAPAQHTDNCPPSGSTWIYGPCETFSRQARRKFSRFQVSMRRGSSLTYLSTLVRPPTEWGRNCKGKKWSSSHQISKGWNQRWSVQKQCGTFIRVWIKGLANRISRGNNKLAPERIRWACGSRLHIIQRVSGGKEWRPILLSNTQSKSLQFNPPKSSHKTYCAWQRVVPPWISRIWLQVPH